MKLFRCINYLLTITQHEVFLKFSSRLATFNITPGQYGVLNCIWSSENGTITPSEISQILRLENSTVSGVLDRMEKAGLIQRLLDPANKRNILVQATAHSYTIKDDVLNLIDELNDEVLQSLTPEEKQTLIALLSRLGQVVQD